MRSRAHDLAAVLLVMLFAPALLAATAKGRSSPDPHEFTRPELAIQPTSRSLQSLKAALPNRAAWDRFLASFAPVGAVSIDPRSGTPTNLLLAVPLIPGGAQGNRLTATEMGLRLSRPVEKVDARVVADSLRRLLEENQQAFAIELAELGPIRPTKVTEDLWQISVPQQKDGIPVRHGRLVATIVNGNLVLLGTEAWANVRISTKPAILPDEAVARGFQYLGGRRPQDRVWQPPTLEIVPVAPAQSNPKKRYQGPVGKGYGHRLVYAFGLERPPHPGRWEVLVDAQTGQVQSIEDTNEYAKRKIAGGVYPRTNTGPCTVAEFCGEMKPNYPMPWANTSLQSPNDFTNGAGLFEYTGGTVTTTLGGKYVTISDSCGSISESSPTGDVDLAGTDGQHDCQVPFGHSDGDTAAARTAFYQVSKIAAMARGWLPTNTWLQQPLTANLNLGDFPCNAFWSTAGYTINFMVSANGCRNTGEISSALLHEWGHGLDRFDAGMTFSGPSEAYADIAALYGTQTSCVGYGVYQSVNLGCGQTTDLTGYNSDQSQVDGIQHCHTNCSGWRDADYARHNPATPDTPRNFILTTCSTDPPVVYSPCGAEKHCAAAPSTQAAWDLARRDLQSLPFSYDSHTAFIIANKIFFQGSGNIGLWHGCEDTAFNGCAAASGYRQWLAADDDNGDLSDGTPHMTAIYNAFHRHEIACDTPAPVNSGCAGAPAVTPVIESIVPGDNQISLSWGAVPNALRYWVFRMEGYAPAEFAKTLIATVTEPATSYTDTEVANGRDYCYLVMAVGASDACFTRASEASCARPQP